MLFAQETVECGGQVNTGGAKEHGSTMMLVFVPIMQFGSAVNTAPIPVVPPSALYRMPVKVCVLPTKSPTATSGSPPPGTKSGPGWIFKNPVAGGFSNSTVTSRVKKSSVGSSVPLSLQAPWLDSSISVKSQAPPPFEQRRVQSVSLNSRFALHHLNPASRSCAARLQTAVAPQTCPASVQWPGRRKECKLHPEARVRTKLSPTIEGNFPTHSYNPGSHLPPGISH